MADTVNHGASVAQEVSVVVAIQGVTRGPSVVDNWTGNNTSGASHILTEGGDILTTEAGDRLITEG
jgi:hypothetical protein